MDPDPSSLWFLANFGYPQMLNLLVILILLLCSALISGSEVALFSLTPADFPEEKDEYTHKQKILSNLLDDPQRLLATVLVANTFVNIAIVLLFDNLGDQLMDGVDAAVFGIKLQFIIKVIVVTFFLLLFGEILPKIYASRENKRFANFMAIPLNVLDKILSVFSVPMEAFTRSIRGRLGHANSGLSVDHLSQALDLADEQDTTQEEQEILQSIVSFGNTDTRQVMQPRTDIFALEKKETYQDIIGKIIDQGFSRIPVYEEGLDNVIGILYVKDLLPYLEKETFEWQKLLRPPYFVPENKKLDDLLNDFKIKKIHLAIVVDEYGGTRGLITMEDIIEEIVGEISDEYDDDELFFSKMDEDNYVLEGKTSLVDFYRIAQIDDTELFEANKGESETVAGFILEISGEFPKKGEKIYFENYIFTVEVVDLKRIIQVKFSRT
ncbi:MAG TPA: gliding motility-associated protein GldE [Flavobacteriaceae bacterium]|nr:gliding motility-associated protein GldE [Flavobacteriaceae bacterium]